MLLISAIHRLLIDYMALRIYCDHLLSGGLELSLLDGDHHYLKNVMRVEKGKNIMLFNEDYGEWEATVCDVSRKAVDLKIIKQYRTPVQEMKNLQTVLLFALVKNKALCNIIRQSTEMGADIIQPIYTDFTNIKSFNDKKWFDWLRGAVEQSGRLDFPVVRPVIRFDEITDNYKDHLLFIADENLAGTEDFGFMDKEVAVIDKVGLIIGPEGGFSQKELASDTFLKLGLGSGILKVDTAVVAGLTYIKLLTNDFGRNKMTSSGY